MEALIGQRIAEAERERLPDQALAVGVVDLVDDEEHLAAGQVADDVSATRLSSSVTPVMASDHHEDDVGLADRLLALAAHLVVERRALGHPAPGVDEREGHALPLGVDQLAVAGDAGLLLHDRGALAHDPVDQRGLADVGPADDRDGRVGREGHGRSSPRAARRAWPSVGMTSTGRGRSSGPVPSRKRPLDRHTSGSR